MSSIIVELHERFAAAGSSLRVRNYRLYFLGQSVSVAGSFMQTLAIAFLTLHLTGSGTDLGIAAATRLLPFLLLGPIGGVIADRYDKRRLLFLTQTSSAIGSIVFAVLALAGTITYPLVLILSLVLGCLTVVDNPARQALIGDLVGRNTLANAVILNSISLNVARVLGSAASPRTRDHLHRLGNGHSADWSRPECVDCLHCTAWRRLRQHYVQLDREDKPATGLEARFPRARNGAVGDGMGRQQRARSPACRMGRRAVRQPVGIDHRRRPHHRPRTRHAALPAPPHPEPVRIDHERSTPNVFPNLCS